MRAEVLSESEEADILTKRFRFQRNRLIAPGFYGKGGGGWLNFCARGALSRGTVK